MTFIIAIVGLLFLVLIHEAGHFFVALAVGIRPRKFYIGFPPAVARFKRNGIEYGIGAIPLGGYVRIPGMHRPAAKDADINFGPAVKENPELALQVQAIEQHLAAAGDHAAVRAELDAFREALDRSNLSRIARKSADRGLRDLEESTGPDAYWRQRTWKRIAVILAGPLTNIVFALLILAAVYMLGVPNANTRIVESVQSGKPAAAAGLRPGDEIVAVNGHSTPTFQAIRNRIQASKGGPITVTVVRHGHRVMLPPERTLGANGRWLFGFVPGVSLRHYSAGAAFHLAADDCWQATKGMGLAIYGLFHQKQRDQLTSAVGIVRVSSDALKVSFRIYLQILGFISLSLALLNLLPLLPLDGGHILFSIIEGVRRRAVAREVYERASMIGFAVILLIAFIALSNDLSGKGPG